MPQLIRDDDQWEYTWLTGNGLHARRRLRLYTTGPGRHVAVITERGDGPSITNAVRDIQAKLAREYPDHVVDVVEHYPAQPGMVGPAYAEHFDLVTDPWTDEQHWRRLPPEELTAWIGADPSETVVDSAAG